MFRANKALSEQRKMIRSRKRELSEIRKELQAAENSAERAEHKKRKKTLQQGIFQLERELRATKEKRAQDEPETGALPDFVVVGGKKCGTTFFYHLLSRHPHVQPAAAKELHFFNAHFDEGTEWYRRCFPQPGRKEGRKTITGEATPEYLSYSRVPERMAELIPQARLIALLRNPVDRAYSDYQMVARKGRESRTFEEAVGLEGAEGGGRKKAPLPGEGGGEAPERRDRTGARRRRCKHLSKSIYVDHLRRWSEYFPKEQMLVLKSEDFFERPVETIKLALDFLDLPEWEPEAVEFRNKRAEDKYARDKLNKGDYGQRMDPATRRRLEEYFEPHNQRLYDYLGVDFKW